MNRYERGAIAALAGFAFLRVLLFAGAYPFFTNVDEHRHVDMVLKYAEGAWPDPGRTAYRPEMGRLLATYGSPEYIQPAGQPLQLPLWEAPRRIQLRRIAASESAFGGAPNLESFQSPAYYALGGAWLALGRGLGLEGGHALYWIRTLNALGLAALVVFAAWLVHTTYPGRGLLRWGVPALVACAPPDGLFYVTGDGLSMFAGGAAFAMLARLLCAPEASARVWCGAGALAAFAFLVKAPNVVLLAAGAWLVFEAWRAEALRPRALRLAALALGFAMPVGAWIVRCLTLTGSALGTAGKVEGLGWGTRPLAAWFSHPLFTPSGLWTFLHELAPMFWRGEVVWHREILSLPAVDAVYAATTALFLALALVGWRRSEAPARETEALAGAVLLGSLGVLAVLSIRFVFGENTNPTADHPYFVQGRLIAGAWLAFAVLYVRGLEVAVAVLPERLRSAAGWTVLGAVLVMCVASELWLARPVFGSAYNIYHLPTLP